MQEPLTRGRFAPTPSGYVHVGNAFCYFLSWLSAHQKGGGVVLRMEDTDLMRMMPEMYGQTMDDLLWLGLTWDAGPTPEGGGQDYLQSNRTSIYEALYEELRRRDLIYPCFCTRSDLKNACAPHASDGHSIYPGTCAHLTAAEREEKARTRSPAWRLRTPDKTIHLRDGLQGDLSLNLTAECGDYPIRRADGVFCYQFVSVVDDALMGVNEVVRSRDLLPSTPQQIGLQELLGYPRPRYYHIPMILDAQGNRMAKRDRGLSIAGLRQTYAPEEVLGRLAFLAGQQETPRARTLSEILADFDWAKLPREDIPLPDGLF